MPLHLQISERSQSLESTFCRIIATAYLFLPALAICQPGYTGCNGQAASGQLQLGVTGISADTGAVQVNGYVGLQLSAPLTWNWGDGSTTYGFFPESHTYQNPQFNYVLTVTAQTSSTGASDCSQINIVFHADQPFAPPPSSIGHLIPALVSAGAPPQTLTIDGTNFVPDSIVKYAGVPHSSTFISPAQLTITLSAADVATPGPYLVVVTNPSPGGGDSNAFYFAVQPLSVPGTWISLGPHHVNGASGEIESGKLQAFAVFNSNPNIMYAGGGQGQGSSGPVTGAGAWKTTDGGAHWAQINNGLVDPVVNALWMDQINPNLVLAGTEGTGIFRSLDGGQTWILVGTPGPTSDFVMANGTLLAATGGGIAQSADMGSTWQVLLHTSVPVRALGAGGGALIAGLDDGTVLMQPSPGSAWTTVIPKLGPNRTASSVAINPAAPNNAYVVLNDSGTSMLQSTEDGGKTWMTLSPPFNLLSIVAFSDSAGSLLYLGCDTRLFGSTDGGRS